METSKVHVHLIPAFNGTGSCDSWLRTVDVTYLSQEGRRPSSQQFFCVMALRLGGPALRWAETHDTFKGLLTDPASATADDVKQFKAELMNMFPEMSRRDEVCIAVASAQQVVQQPGEPLEAFYRRFRAAWTSAMVAMGMGSVDSTNDMSRHTIAESFLAAVEDQNLVREYRAEYEKPGAAHSLVEVYRFVLTTKAEMDDRERNKAAAILAAAAPR